MYENSQIHTTKKKKISIKAYHRPGGNMSVWIKSLSLLRKYSTALNVFQ